MGRVGGARWNGQPPHPGMHGEVVSCLTTCVQGGNPGGACRARQIPGRPYPGCADLPQSPTPLRKQGVPATPNDTYLTKSHPR